MLDQYIDLIVLDKIFLFGILPGNLTNVPRQHSLYLYQLSEFV